jgi:hypothetical protein
MHYQEQLSNLIQAEGVPPYVSLILPLAKTIPERLQNKVHLQALCKQALEILSHDTSQQARQVAERIKNIAHTADIDHAPSEALAFFVGAQQEIIIPLYAPCSAEVKVGSLFALGPVIHALQCNLRFWVLVLNRKHARLFSYDQEKLHEVVTPLKNNAGEPLQGFPLDALPPEDKFLEAVGTGDRDAHYRDAEVTKFFQLVDRELSKILTTPAPLILCTSPEYSTSFMRTTHHKDAVKIQIHHNYTNHPQSPETLRHDVEHALKNYLDDNEKKLLTEFEDALNHRKQACTLTHVWEMASVGRILKLFIEPDLPEVGRINPDFPANLQVYDHKTDDTIDSVSDLLIHETLRHGGTVYVVKKGSLKACKGYGAILRY